MTKTRSADSVKQRSSPRFPFLRVLYVVPCLWLVLNYIDCQKPQVTAPKSQPAQALTAGSLDLESAIEKSISSHDEHIYLLQLSTNQQISLRLDKGDLRLELSIRQPAGQTYIQFLSSDYGAVEIPFTAGPSGVYRVEIRGLENDAASRPYRLLASAVHVDPTKHKAASDATQRMAEAEKLRAQWDSTSLRSAIGKYKEGSRLWEIAGEFRKVAESLRHAGDIYRTLNEYQQALQQYNEALVHSERAGDQQGITAALNSIGYVYIYTAENEKAQSYIERALANSKNSRKVARDVNSRRAEAQALNNLGEINYSFGDLRKSISLFERALEIWAEAGGDRVGAAQAELNIGYSLSDQGELAKALEHYQKALAQWQSVDDRRGVATAQTALGGVYSALGEEQRALDLHKEALTLFRSFGDIQMEAVTLNGIASVYDDLNDKQTALDNYEQALRLYQQIGNQDFVALTKLYVGRTYSSLGAHEQALRYYQDSIELSSKVGNRSLKAYALKEIGSMYSESEPRRALKYFETALSFYQGIGNRRKQVEVLNNICHIYSNIGEHQKAVECFGEALPLSEASGDRRQQALALFNIARLKRNDGDIQDALAKIEASIEIIESLRASITSRELQMSYFASVHQHYELYVDLLMRLHKLRPTGHFDSMALLASERGRARALLETLIGAGSRLYQGADQALFQREQSLRQLISAKSEYQTRLLDRHDEEELRRVSGELSRLKAEYEVVQGKIAEQDPRYAYLTQPRLLRIDDIQRELTDENTLLLEFSLGDERSYLWVATATTIESFELPDRKTIESSVRDVYALLTARVKTDGETDQGYSTRVAAADTQYWSRAQALSRMLLGPVAERLGNKRLMIVSDGLLQYLPWDALPDPRTESSLTSALDSTAFEPLLVRHEVIGLPSAMVLATFRRRDYQAAPKTIAVLADPVLTKDDPRVGQTSSISVSKPANNGIDNAELAPELRRLPYATVEGQGIVSLLPSQEVMFATGFDANRTLVSSDELSNYRILHFATPAFFNSDHPELSGVVLSMLDKYGIPQNGYLSLKDIYGLNIRSDLVVLSACRTGAGRIVSGEGVVGLTHGFMYAGSKTVVSSLWETDDQRTAELMKSFYYALFVDRLPPAAALRQAKLAMWKRESSSAPYFWGSFVLQGEYKNTLAPTPAFRKSFSIFWIVGAAIVLACGCYVLVRLLKRHAIVSS